MLKLKKIAVTGDLGAGKSATCSCLRSLGAFVISADDLSHQLLLDNRECINAVVHLLGEGILSKGLIDRKKVATLVFPDKKKLEKLEKILHPLIFKKMEEAYHKACDESNYRCFVAEVPLLYETSWDKFFDKVIFIQASEEIRKSRCREKGLEDFSLRTTHLLKTEEKLKKADLVVINNGSLEQLKLDLEKNIKSLLS